MWEKRVKGSPFVFHLEMGKDIRLLGTRLRKKVKSFGGTCFILDGWWTFRTVIECL